jgi:nitroreductase
MRLRARVRLRGGGRPAGRRSIVEAGERFENGQPAPYSRAPFGRTAAMSRPVANETLLSQLRWRYACKSFDRSRKIAPEDWQTLEEALILSPSSYGIQPWKFVVVTDPATREKLLPISFNQPQIVDSSHLVVFCIKKPLRREDVDAFVARTAEVRGIPVDALAKFRAVMVNDLIEGARSWKINDWAANQVFIALGNFMTSAALLAIDTCPMEGFEPPKYDQALGLARRGLASAVLCAAGYRLADDKYATTKKVRFPSEQVIEHV